MAKKPTPLSLLSFSPQNSSPITDRIELGFFYLVIVTSLSPIFSVFVLFRSLEQEDKSWNSSLLLTNQQLNRIVSSLLFSSFFTFNEFCRLDKKFSSCWGCCLVMLLDLIDSCGRKKSLLSSFDWMLYLWREKKRSFLRLVILDILIDTRKSNFFS